MVMNWLDERDRQPELMDQPDLDLALHHGALAGLTRVNAISGTVAAIWGPIAALAAECPGKTLRVLDVASGGGDVAIGIALRAQRAGLSVEVDGCDMSDTAIEYASQRARTAGAISARFFKADALGNALPEGYDVICSSLFLHHLESADIQKLLTSMRERAERLVVVSDLLRSRLGYVLCWTGIRLLTRSRICHVDGPLSVRAALTMAELRTLATVAGLEDAQLAKNWPERVLLTWRRNA